MAFKRYNHLNVPDSWERYFTKYPQGMSILESLFEWVSQVDSMVDNQNKLNDTVEQFRTEIDVFVERFDDRLQEEVTQILSDWQSSGFLEVVITESLQWQLDDYITTNEQDKLSINQQLDKTTNNLITLEQNTYKVVDVTSYEYLKEETINGYDWQPAIQKAIDDHESEVTNESVGVEIFLPAYEYGIVEPIIIRNSNTRLIGSGRGSIIKNIGLSLEPMIKIVNTDRPQQTMSISGVYVSNLTIDGVNKQRVGVALTGVVRGSLVNENYIINCKHGITLTGCWSMGVHDNQIDYCEGTGIWLGGREYDTFYSRLANAINTTGNIVRYCRTGIRLEAGSANFLSGNTLELNDLNLDIWAILSAVVIGNYIEAANGTEEVKIGGTLTGISGGITQGLVFEGNFLYSNKQTDNLKLYGCINSTFKNNFYVVKDGKKFNIASNYGRIYENLIFETSLDLDEAPRNNIISKSKTIFKNRVRSEQSSSAFGFQMGVYRLWVDGDGDLRIKHGEPSHEEDGKKVGL